MIIRRAEAKDVDTLAKLAIAAYEVYVSRKGLILPQMSYDYAKIVEEEQIYVIDEGGTVVSMLTLTPQDLYLLLRNLATFPQYQGRGYGRRFLEFAEGEARRLRLPEMRLWTNEKLVENITYYLKFGFVETHRATTDGYARVYMSKYLA